MAFKHSLQNLDRPGGMLALGNVLFLVLALASNWSVSTVVWAYWCESILIGVFLLMKYVITAKHEGKTTKRIGYLTAVLFAINWGIFHLAEVFVINNINAFGLNALFATPPTVQFILALVIVFFIQSVLFFSKDYTAVMDEKNQKKLAKELQNSFFGPYGKIAPNHLSILLIAIVVVALNIWPELAMTSFAPVAFAIIMLFKITDSLWIYTRAEAA